MRVHSSEKVEKKETEASSKIIKTIEKEVAKVVKERIDDHND